MVSRGRLFVALTFLAIASPCLAQPSVLLKAGANIERSEDGLSGESPALGVDLLVPLGDRWRLDAQVWLPAYFTAAHGVRHRDILWLLGAQRPLGASRLRPFIAFGVGHAQMQEQRDDLGDRGGSSGILYIGGGVRIPVGDRLAIVPELRASGGPGFGLVRPAVGIEWTF